MPLMDTIKAKLTGQQSAVDGRIASEVRGKIPGQQTADTPVMNRIREKVPAQQNQGGPIRERIAKVTARNGNGGNGNGGDNGPEVNDLAGLFGDERHEQSPRGLGPKGAGLFGRDLG